MKAVQCMCMCVCIKVVPCGE